MGKKNKKQKQQRRIAKIIADGRVTKKEAKKAAKKGISLARIQKAQTKSFKPGNVFSNIRAPKKSPFAGGVTSRGAISQGRVSPSQVKTPQQPAYTPLTIQGAAQKIFDRGTAAAAAPAPVVNQTVAQAPVTPPPPPPVVEPEEPSMEDMFGDMIAGLQGAYQQSLAAQQEQFAAMEAQQQQQMALLQQQMQSQQQAMSAQAQLAGRPSVMGVQYAQSSAGSPAQIAARGASGAFGRGGMRIQSLNV